MATKKTSTRPNATQTQTDASVDTLNGPSEKITAAKCILQAVRTASDSEAMDGVNYDAHWPLTAAIDLLEQANAELCK